MRAWTSRSSAGDGTRTLDIQVKARFSGEAGSKSLYEKRIFRTDVRAATFKPRPDLYMLFVAVDAVRADLDLAWLVPSTDFENEGFRVVKAGKEHVRFQASAKDQSGDKWSPCRIARDALPARLLAVVSALEASV